MISVAAYDVACILVYLLVPSLVFVPVLPARGGYDDKQAQFVAGIHERRVLRIVCRADNGKAGIAQSLGVTPLLAVRQGIAHISEVLMTVSTHQLLVLPAIEVEAGLATLGIVRSDELEGADAYLRDATVQAGFTLLDASGYTI